MRTTSKTPRLRIVAGTAYAPTETGIPASTTPRLIGLSSNTKLTSHFDDRPSTGSLSTTAENGRLREKRYEAWREAEAATRYWRARLDFHDALSSVQRRAMSEGRSHPAADDEDRQALVNGWRAAFVRQLLTPAPLAASVTWKQAALARGKYLHAGLKPERLKRAIAEDLAFLAAHPVRQSKPKGYRR